MNTLRNKDYRNKLCIKCCSYKNNNATFIDCKEENMYTYYNSIIYLLEKYDMDLTIKNEDGLTLIELVLHSDFNNHIKYKIIELLIKHKININDKKSNGNTIIYDIIILNDHHLMKLFIKNGGIININNNEMITPLQYAIRLNKICMVQILLENNAIINDTYTLKNDFYTCMLYNREYLLHTLFEYYHKKDESKNKMALYHLCILSTENIIISPKIFDILENNHITLNDIDCDTYNVLQYAINKNKIYMIDFLLNHHIDIEYKNNMGETALHIAAMNLNKKMIEILLEKGANINAKNKDGNTVMHNILQNNLNISSLYSQNTIEDIIKLLLENENFNINTGNNEGNSILHIAIMNKKYEYIELILKYGKNINMNVVNNEGLSFLHMSVKYSHFDLFKKILESNVDKSLITVKNKTVLHYIVRNSNIKLLELFLSNKINRCFLNKKDVNGYTPFFILVKHNNIKFIEYILNNYSMDINMNIPNNNGVIPLQYAKSNNYHGITEILEKYSNNEHKTEKNNKVNFYTL